MIAPGPFLPRVQEAYWVDATILPFAGAGGQQAVVVLDVPATTLGTIGVDAARRRPGPGPGHPLDAGERDADHDGPGGGPRQSLDCPRQRSVQ